MSDTTFNVLAAENEDSSELRVNVIDGPHVHPSMFLHQTDIGVDDKPFDVLITVSKRQMIELRALIDRTLAGEFK